MVEKEQPKKDNIRPRPPVVVILGHIDHGKTSILDFIRKTKVVEKESGGITQHIGAYQIVCPPSPSAQAEGRQEHQGKKITFIDTPGHEAFSAMRSRGAKVADIAILVIDAYEGIKSQTKEAILEIKKSGIPMIVALNKIDKFGADPERVKRELADQGILVESMAGKIPSVEVSAKTGQGISELLELILLIAEIEDLKADISGSAEGIVIESYLDNLRGPSATLLLNKGVLKVGDILGTSSVVGKIKNLENFQGSTIQEAEPSVPVKVIGFENIPKIGDTFKVFSNLETAKSYFNFSKEKPAVITFISNEKKFLNLILKTDYLGSSEAIEEILNKLPQEKIVIRILKSENGEVNETDVKLAKAANAWILAFRVKINQIAQSLIEKEKVKIIQFQVIYELVEAVRGIMEKMLKPEIIRVDLGKVKILVNFLIKKNRQIIGGKVIEGEIKKGVLIEVLRGEELVGRGRLINLERNKKEIEKATKGEECGILFEGDIKIEEGDILVIHIEEKRGAGL
jgi:translation initiation factor IF-2